MCLARASLGSRHFKHLFSKSRKPRSKKVTEKKRSSSAKAVPYPSSRRCMTPSKFLACSSASVCQTKTHTPPTNTSPSKIISAASRPSPISILASPLSNSGNFLRGKSLEAAFLRVIHKRLSKKPHFSGLFCCFSLRSTFTLAIVRNGPSFSAEKQGVVRSRPAPLVAGGKVNTGG